MGYEDDIQIWFPVIHFILIRVEWKCTTQRPLVWFLNTKMSQGSCTHLGRGQIMEGIIIDI